MSETLETGRINIIGIRFKARGKEYSFDATDTRLKKGDKVIVDTENGLAIGTVSTEVRKLSRNELPDNLKKVVRKAQDEDLVTEEENAVLEEKAFEFCDGRIRERNLPMKLIDVECLFDKSKVVFYFTADSRVDFRELVKDLVQEFRSRIELRQIWVRSEARILGGMGICGRELCCVSFLNNFEPVSIKMAKEQNMLLNPEKISGRCGRLMCCLAFEYGHYCDTKKKLPKCGMTIQTSQGHGKIVRQDLLRETIVVLLDDGKEVELSGREIMERNSFSL
ncbi:MAG TPA: stage 0 sporulation protein [Deltaproteobacteria bacterium]|jgi:cell fate regulator YaaT (PSP1 superfamily)|nr:stage 0 sporulation protein [Deltaproteobacteria bacterium]